MALLVVAGSYEGGLYGWDADCSLEGEKWSVADEPKLIFSFQAHMGCIKSCAVDASGDLLATGGLDEYIKLFNLRTRKERGELAHHRGAVTSLNFFKSSHLLSASADGTVCIWRTQDWLCLHVLGGHKDAVNSVSVHPSGRMAISGGRDRTLRLWNLVEGRCAYITKPSIPKAVEIDQVAWSPSGSTYALIAGSSLMLFDATESGTPKAYVTHSQTRRINAIKFIGDDAVVIGGDDCMLQIVSASTGEVSCRTDGAMKARIKDIAVVVRDSSPPLICSVGSTGELHFWDLSTTGEGMHLSLLAKGSAPGQASRLTCTTVTLSSNELCEPPIRRPLDVKTTLKSGPKPGSGLDAASTNEAPEETNMLEKSPGVRKKHKRK